MKRDVLLDSLRGLLLVVMTIDHLAIAFHDYTIHSLGFITAAEGFVFLSGFVAGLVYTGVRVRKQADALWSVAINRVRSIYFSHIALFIFILLLGISSKGIASAWQLTIPYFDNPLILTEPLKAFGLGALLLYQPAYLDILPLYCIFLLLTPYMIEKFIAGQSWRVFVVSGGIWLFAQFGGLALITNASVRLVPINLGFFDLLAWQLIFVSGLYLGSKRYLQPESFSVNRLVYVGAAIVAVLLFLISHNYFGGQLSGWRESLTSKEHLGILRLLNFAALSYLIAGARSIFTRILNNQWLTSLGQHSLQVFTFHVLLVFLLSPILPQLRSMPSWIAAIVTIAALLSLSLPVWCHERYREVMRLFKPSYA